MQFIKTLEEAFPNHIITDSSHWTFSDITQQMIVADDEEITFVKKNSSNSQFFKYMIALEATKGKKCDEDIDIIIIINTNNYIPYFEKYVESMGKEIFIDDVMKYL
jgi:hypothetical protein